MSTRNYGYNLNCLHCGAKQERMKKAKSMSKRKSSLTVAVEVGNSHATGHVASVRMPLPLAALTNLLRFAELAYGPCTVREHPEGWLQVTTATQAGKGGR